MKRFVFSPLKDAILVYVPLFTVFLILVVGQLVTAKQNTIVQVNRTEERQLKTQKGLLLNKFRSVATDLDVLEHLVKDKSREELEGDLRRYMSHKKFYKTLIVDFGDNYDLAREYDTDSRLSIGDQIYDMSHLTTDKEGLHLASNLSNKEILWFKKKVKYKDDSALLALSLSLTEALNPAGSEVDQLKPGTLIIYEGRGTVLYDSEIYDTEQHGTKDLLSSFIGEEGHLMNDLGSWHWDKIRLQDMILTLVTHTEQSFIDEAFQKRIYPIITYGALLFLSFIPGGLIIISEIRKKRIEVQKDKWQANHDTLTKCLNRKAGMAQLNSLIRRSRQQKVDLSVMFVDLDNLHLINTTYGHAAGDIAIYTVAQSILSSIRSRDLMFRLGGDEFVVATFCKEDSSHVTDFARRLQVATRQSFPYLDSTLNISASIGYVTFSPYMNIDADGAINLSDKAMYAAKSHERGSIYSLTPDGSDSDKIKKISREVIGEKIVPIFNEVRNVDDLLATSISQERLFLLYQPILNKDGHIVGTEALLRLKGTGGEILTPYEFINLAERMNMMIDIDNWVINAAFRDAKHMLSTKPDLNLISINISAVHLQSSKDAEQLFSKLVKESELNSLDPSKIMLEITETARLPSLPNITDILEKIREYGFSLALDDFGCGYSSLIRLKELPFSHVKFEKNFTCDITDNKKNIEIVRSAINMARGLDLKTIAESIETVGQLSILQELGVDYFQGYLIGRPMSISNLTKFFKDFSIKKFTLPEDFNV